ncbi:MAG: hypothetical protein PF486_00565 [Prolixibacteraceae bacterium]|jgi:hypothetical protein|nr:hypothetical protein [Prolixibacteraceae bacterium]
MKSLIKKQILLTGVFCALVFVVKAQSTPIHPYEGATHNYVVNGLTSGTNFLFYVSAHENGSEVLDDGAVFEFDFLDSHEGVVPEGESTASLPVLWNNGASQYIYYLWIELSNPGGCATRRGLKILPQPNRFDLLSENIPVDNTESCPAISKADGFNPMADEYSAGTSTVKFKVRREGGNRAWSFEPIALVEPDWNVDVAVVSIVAVNAGVIDADESNIYTVLATDDEVIVTVAVRNFEGTEQIVSMKVKNQQEENTMLSDSNHENDNVQHHITVMPVIMELEEI